MHFSFKYIFILTALSAFSCSDSNNSKSAIEQVVNESTEKENLKNITSSSPIKTGQEIALNTKGILGRNLMNAINTKGTEHAITFCSTKAIPLTDSTGLSLNAKIKRVSDKSRNPNNKANKKELEYIEATKLVLSQNKVPKPQLTTVGDKQVGYYPILTNQMCMQCHGQAQTEVLPKTLLKLESLYPNDQATGYGINELRGIWVVEMDEK